MPDGAPRVGFVTLGCKVNQTDSEAIAEALGVAGEGADHADAEVVVINTCTVTGEADRKARKAVRHALGMRQSPVVVVTGCLAALDAAALRALGDRVVVEADKDRVPDRVREHLAGSTAGSNEHASFTRSRVQLKIQDGCDAFCAYCVVPYARGVPRTVPLEAVVARASRLADAGVAEVVLTGINIGRYNDRSARLPDVLEAVAATGIRRIRLSSIEPRDVDDRLLEVACHTRSFCPHLHIPLQSGADAVLDRMGRPYDTARFAGTVAQVRSAFPGVAISTDIIAGFPGESDAEFDASVDFVESQRFSRLHVFRYSAREGTPAASMPGHVAPDVKARRAAALRQLGERLARDYAVTRIGTTAELLVECVTCDARGEAWAEGTIREYVRAVVPAGSITAGTLLPVAIESVDADRRLGGRPLS